jgi:hypothetical protein
MTYLAYLSLKNLAVDMVIGTVLPPLNSSAIDVRWKRKMPIARWADLDTVTVSEWDREIN